MKQVAGWRRGGSPAASLAARHRRIGEALDGAPAAHADTRTASQAHETVVEVLLPGPRPGQTARPVAQRQVECRTPHRSLTYCLRCAGRTPDIAMLSFR